MSSPQVGGTYEDAPRGAAPRNAGANPRLSVRDVTLRFGGMAALTDVSLTVGVGETVAVIGPNGAGKTTLFNCITRTYHDNEGSIELDGISIARLSDYAVTRQGVARTFQHPVLFPDMTVEENVAFGLDLKAPIGYISALLRPVKVAKAAKARERRVGELLELLDLTAIRHDKAAALPQGLRRLVELGRALAMKPRLLLLDEPVAGLNTQESEHFAGLLRRVATSDEISVLLIEHDLPFVLGLADRVVVLNFGQVIATGTPAQIQRDPRVIEAYLGTTEGIG